MIRVRQGGEENKVVEKYVSDGEHAKGDLQAT